MNSSSVLAWMPVPVLLSMLLVGSSAFAGDGAVVDGPITCRIEYQSVGHLEELDDQGWLLAWKAQVSGDFEGVLKWWFPSSPPAPESSYTGGEVGYYLARWELWRDEELILAGESAGKTVFSEGEDGIWDGHGIVLNATGNLSSLKGRRIYETGTVIVPPDPSVPSSGSGMFVVY